MALEIFGIRIGKSRKKTLSGAALASSQGKHPANAGRKKGSYGEKTIQLQMARLKLQEQRLVLQDKKAKFEEMREKRAKGGMGEMRETLKAAREIREAFRDLKDDEGDADGMQGMAMNALKALGAGLAQAAIPMFQAQAAAQQAQQQPSQPGTHVVNNARQLPPPAPERELTPEEQITMNVNRIMSELHGKSPRDAAAWLLMQRGFIEMQVKDALVNTPDAQIPQLIPQVRGFSVPMADFLESRLPWLVDVAHELRGMMNGTAPIPMTRPAPSTSPL